MKKTFFITCLSILPFIACSQDVSQQQVPSLVVNSFYRHYPKAEDVEWEKQQELYNAEFEISDIDHEVWINGHGDIVKHETELVFSELPEALRQKILTDYADAKVDDIKKTEDGAHTYYVVEFEKRTGDLYIRFNEDGSIYH